MESKMLGGHRLVSWEWYVRWQEKVDIADLEYVITRTKKIHARRAERAAAKAAKAKKPKDRPRSQENRCLVS
jgi:hypothetical protein